jgi:hypothetical protein
MVILEGTIAHKVFQHRVGEELERTHDDLIRGLARICAGTMFVYLFMQILTFVHSQNWPYLATGWGAWYLLELVGFVALPMALFLVGTKNGGVWLIRAGAILTIFGIILNRLNVTVIGFKWYAPVRYVPSWQEIVVTLAVISAEIWVFRWVVNRMPVLGSESDSANATPGVVPETAHAAT